MEEPRGGTDERVPIRTLQEKRRGKVEQEGARLSSHHAGLAAKDFSVQVSAQQIAATNYFDQGVSVYPFHLFTEEVRTEQSVTGCLV